MPLPMLINETGPMTQQLRVPEIHHHKATKDAGIPIRRAPYHRLSRPSSSSSYAV